MKYKLTWPIEVMGTAARLRWLATVEAVLVTSGSNTSTQSARNDRLQWRQEEKVVLGAGGQGLGVLVRYWLNKEKSKSGVRIQV
ncbi:hypothetical protein Ancab_021382 [Ancistrocladus abbreviatus]